MSHTRGGWTAALVLLLAGCAVGAPSAPKSNAQPPTLTPAPLIAEDRVATPERIDGTFNLHRPAQPVMAASFRADLVADHCTDRDLPAPPVADDALAVLDRSYSLPVGYAPQDLVAASAAGLSGPSGMKLLRAVVVDDLAAMAVAWEAAGLTVILESAYRSQVSQAATFDGWVARVGYAEALTRTARPGHSEHQLGTAVDLTSPGWSGRFGDWAVESDEGAWMAAHGWEFGFVMSYPAGSQDGTCFSYEPWHYRWIGREAAAAHRGSELDLRRFLERYVGA